MPIPPNIASTLRALDKKIAELEETKRRLLQAFAQDGAQIGRRAQPIREAQPDPGSSAARLVTFLRERGPATRQEILENSGVPRGSISYLLKIGAETNILRKRQDDKWELVA